MWRKTAGGNCGLCNHLCRFCNVYSNGEVMSCGNSRLFAYSGTKEQSYLRSLSHSLPFSPPPFLFRFCEQQWLILLIYPDKEFPWSPHFSAFKKNVILHFCIAILFCCLRAITHNQSRIRHRLAQFPPTSLLDPLYSYLDWSQLLYLCWNRVETLSSSTMLLSFSSFSHNLTLSPSLWGIMPEP